MGAYAGVVDARGVGDAPRELLRGGRERGRQAEVILDGGAGVEGEVGVALEDRVSNDLARTGLLQEDAAAGAVLGPDERGHEHGAVEHPLGHGAELLGLDDDAVDELVGGHGERRDPQRGAGTGQVVRFDFGGRAAGKAGGLMS